MPNTRTAPVAPNQPGLTDSPDSRLLPEPAKQSAIAVPVDNEWADVDDGSIGHTPDLRLSFPRYVGDMRPGGGWADQKTGEKVEYIEFVWLANTQSRAYWDKKFGEGDGIPVCRSADMVRPDPGSPQKQAEMCAGCPMAQFGDNNEAPKCKSRVNVLGFDVNSTALFEIAFSGTAIKHVRQYLSALKSTLPVRPPMARITAVGLEQVERDGMRWLEPRFKVESELSRADVEPLIGLRSEFAKQWQDALAEDLAQAQEATFTDVSGTGPAAGPFDGERVTHDSNGNPLDEPF